MSKKVEYTFESEHISAHWDDEKEIFFINVHTQHAGEEVLQDHTRAFLEFVPLMPENVLIDQIVDVTRCHRLSPKGRRVAVELLKHPRIKSICLCGVNMMMRTMVKFLAAAVGRQDRVFAYATVEEGLKLIEERNNPQT